MDLVFFFCLDHGDHVAIDVDYVDHLDHGDHVIIAYGQDDHRDFVVMVRVRFRWGLDGLTARLIQNGRRGLEKG